MKDGDIMGGAIQITQKSGEWETSELHPGLRWQFSVNTGVTDSNGLSCGYLQLAAGAELPLHFHKEQEIYIITKGNAELLTDENATRSVRAGDTVYIPESSWHGIRNTGRTNIEFIWIFPTDSWQEVRYVFANADLNQPPTDFSD
jgi:oxalate decarboxylase/phosphoglucose isomerase-like protein (cupin superfamily)